MSLKIVHRYIAGEFLRPFLLTLSAFATILLISNIFDEMSVVLDNHARLTDAAVYFLLKIPFLLLQITPLAVLLATLFCMGGLAKSNEVTAMRTGGASLFFLIQPVLAVALVISLVSLLFNELVVPWANRTAAEVRRTNIEHAPLVSKTTRSKVAFIGSQGHIYYIKTFDEGQESMQEVTIFEYLDGAIKKRLDAETAHYESDGWHFYNGTLREFYRTRSGEREKETAFQETAFAVDEKPEDFHVVEKKRMELMSSMELWDYIKELQKKGFPCTREWVEYYLKFSFPFANLIMAWLAFPFATQVKRTSGIVIGFCLSLMVAFIYVGFVQVGRAMGSGNLISPFWSVWLANLFFALLGGWRMHRANR